jgi:hypothetical protein
MRPLRSSKIGPTAKRRAKVTELGRWPSMAPSTLSCPLLVSGPRYRRHGRHGPSHPEYEAIRRGSALARLSLSSSVASLISPHGRIQMLRFALPAVALVGVLAMAQPVFANPLAATVSDHAQAAAAAIEQPASPAPPWSSSSDAPATSARLDKNIAPAGFGWG